MRCSGFQPNDDIKVRKKQFLLMILFFIRGSLLPKNIEGFIHLFSSDRRHEPNRRARPTLLRSGRLDRICRTRTRRRVPDSLEEDERSVSHSSFFRFYSFQLKLESLKGYEVMMDVS